MATLRVMTFNLLLLNRDFRGLAASVASEAPDIVALQELSPRAARALGVALQARYPYHALRPAGDGHGGGVLSRFPIQKEEPFRLSWKGHLCQHLVIALPERELHFYNIHLSAPRLGLLAGGYNAGRRESEAAALAERLAGHPAPLVVAGDFNMTDGSPAYRRLTNLLRDAHREAGRDSGRTFPNPVRIGPLRVPLWPVPFPIIRIDYVFHSPDLAAREAHCGRNGGSDHRPVVATLACGGG